MASNPRSDRPKIENYQDSDDFKIERVKSAPPQNISDESFVDPQAELESMMGNLSISKKTTDEIDEFECVSDIEDEISPFEKFILFEKLLQQFPKADINAIKDKVLSIANLNERTPVEISFCFSKGDTTKINEKINEKINKLKNKTNTCMEKVRLEFNRATTSNLPSVIQNLTNIKVEKNEEMKEISNFVFEKIISDPVFFDCYMTILGSLYKTWQSEEEKLNPRSQTCFFGSMLSLAHRKIYSSYEWFEQADQSSFSSIDPEDLDDKIEENFAERTRRRNNILGTVEFICAIYIKNFVGPNGILEVIDRLISSNSPENIIMVCKIFTKISQKFYIAKRTNELEKIVNYLKTNLKTNNMRLQIEIENALASNPMAVNVKSFSSQKKNSFSSMMMETDSSNQKTDDEVLNEYITERSKAISATHEDDIGELQELIFKDIDRFDNVKFLNVFITEMITNFKNYPKLKNMLLDRLLPKALKLVDALLQIKENLGFLVLDAPVAMKNYSELLCYLKGKGCIDEEEFNSLKTTEFIKTAGNLLREWQKSGDERLGKVLSSSEIEKL